MPGLKDFYHLAKPGIVRGNMLSLLAGYVLAATLYGFDLPALIGVLIGTAGVIASGCVFNNYLDRFIDAKMKRTRQRALVTHTVSNRAAILYGSGLGLVGFASLWFLTNPLTTLVGVVGFVWYVVIYGFAKRHTPWSTLIGTVCGATPPVAGYVALAGQIDAAAILLFLILVAWQMPHFYAIAIRRRDDYAAAGLPLLSITHGVDATRRQIVIWIVAFMVVTPMLTIAGYTGMVYLTASVALGVYWLSVALQTWKEPNQQKWAGRIFGISLLVLLLQSALIAVGHLLP